MININKTSWYDLIRTDCLNYVYNINSSFDHKKNLFHVYIFSDDMYGLQKSCRANEESNRNSEPLVLIGIYIAIASAFCILPMVADLFHGFRNRKFWFPCKYFTLNAASITVIAITMKLPMDLSSLMNGVVDQAAKLGSTAFLCMMMANLMPSLASMNNKTLVANIIGLITLVITIYVNMYIQIMTGAIGKFHLSLPTNNFDVMYLMIWGATYMILMIILLIILVSSAITIPTCKQILEFKYQAAKRTTSIDSQDIGMSTIEKLRQYVRQYWVMAETGNPQFVMAGNPLSNAAGIICATILVMYLRVVLKIFFTRSYMDYQSDYKWSTLAIFITQVIGVVVGSIAPVSRCFTVFKFNMFTINQSVLFEIDKHWTQKLHEWKESRVPFLSNARRLRALIHNFKNRVLSYCIAFQNIVVVLCKTVGFIRILVLILVVHCSYCWKLFKGFLFNTPIASTSDDTDEDLHTYVLQIEDEMEFAEMTVKGISNSMNRLIQKVNKEQHDDLLELLGTSTGFEGVEKFDIDQVESLLPVQPVNSWSLPVVTLTCIALALPDIRRDKVESLFKGVGDAISYTHLVEESLNNASKYVNVRKATMKLWHEVEDNCKWLENTLARNAYQGKTSAQILKLFIDKARKIVIEIRESTNDKLMGRFSNKLIVANSMYRIATTILLNYQNNIEPIHNEQLFVYLSCVISDILCACFTNIPRTIVTKCNESVIEKRVASVDGAARLLGRSTEIIERLEACELPNMDPDKMAFIDEWRLHLMQSIP